MQLLKLFLKIIVAMSVLIQPVEALAAFSKSHSGKKSHKKSIENNPGNVWERIRFGMQIPTLTVIPPSTQNLPSSNSAKTMRLATLHDDTSRIKLNEVKVTSSQQTKPSLSTTIQKQIVDYVNNSQPTQARIHTRLEFHPHTNKLDATAKALINPTSIIIKTVATIPPLKTETKLAPSLLEEHNVTNQQQNIKQVLINERISKHIAWYTGRSAYLQQVAERARPYLYHIVNGLSANHLPVELALLPIVESAYQATAESPKSAAGLWQIIPSTGLDLDLAQSEYYDDRLDIDASTQAAIRYLAFLKRHFNGDWLLALAAYNCGLGRVDEAIRLNKANGLDADYWSLNLPEETQQYVPRFLALSNIFANPTIYGLKLPAIRNEPYFVKVKVNRQFDINYLSKKSFSAIAELANLSYEQFTQLNPGYLKPTPETDEPFTLLLPATNAKQLHQHLGHVERFLTEFKNAPLQQNVRVDDVLLSLSNKLPKFTSPLLSLNLKTNQTTPRITNLPILFS